MHTNEAPIRYCLSCGRPEHGSLACEATSYPAPSPAFDLHAAIKRLAEAEWKCNGPSWLAGTHDECADKGIPCDKCGDTGHIVPFVALRVASCAKVGPHWHRTVYYNPQNGRPCNEGWVAEPDMEKAAHRIARRVQELDCGGDIVTWWYDEDEGRWYWNNPQGSNIPAGSYEEAVLCAAEALAKEQQHGL